MNDVHLTIVGNVVDEPRMRMTKNNHAVTSFRVASTSRRYDREQERFVDQDTFLKSRLGLIRRTAHPGRDERSHAALGCTGSTFPASSGACRRAVLNA